MNVFSKGGRETLILCRDSLAEGARSAIPVGIACAIVGIIIGTMTLTGVANTFGQYIVRVGENSLLLSLVLTMLTCIVLGMGIPTIPNYIITSSIAGPGTAGTGRAADRQPHVRLLFRNPGGPHAAGGPGLLCRCADRHAKAG